MTSIELRNVSIDVPIYGVGSRNVKGSVMRRLQRRFDTETVWIRALDNISLALGDGGRLGLIGANGAGKTTLLRVLAGILAPTSGDVTIKGSVAAMFDLGLGMNEEDTGAENAMMRGLLLGHTREEMNEMLPSIIEFSGIGDRINHPMRTYSSGMRARLSFSISTAINPEILLVDEGIGMADAAFTERASQRLNAFMERAGLLVLASHSDALVRQFCETGLVLDKGRMAFMGPVDEAVEFYKGSVARS